MTYNFEFDLTEEQVKELEEALLTQQNKYYNRQIECKVMTDKELLLVDLYARVPYVVKGVITYDKDRTLFTVEGFDNNVLHLSDAEECYVEDFKPYLRPMSSMTKEERKEYHRTFFYHERYDNEHKTGQNCSITFETYDWLNKHHFDYRGLIKKGLALEAPEGMYNIKEK